MKKSTFEPRRANNGDSPIIDVKISYERYHKMAPNLFDNPRIKEWFTKMYPKVPIADMNKYFDKFRDPNQYDFKLKFEVDVGEDGIVGCAANTIRAYLMNFAPVLCLKSVRDMYVNVRTKTEYGCQFGLETRIEQTYVDQGAKDGTIIEFTKFNRDTNPTVQFTSGDLTCKGGNIREIISDNEYYTELPLTEQVSGKYIVTKMTSGKQKHLTEGPISMRDTGVGKREMTTRIKIMAKDMAQAEEKVKEIIGNAMIDLETRCMNGAMSGLLAAVYDGKGVAMLPRSVTVLIDKEHEFLLAFIKSNINGTKTKKINENIVVLAPEVTQVCGNLKLEFEFAGEPPADALKQISDLLAGFELRKKIKFQFVK